MVFKKGNKEYKKRSNYKGKNNPFHGQHHTEESKKKMGHKKGDISNFFGKHHTKLSKQKMRDKKKNYIPWNKGKKGLQKAWNNGLTKENSESVAKYAKNLEEREFSSETKKKISDSRWGKNNPAWAGGNSFYPYHPNFNRKFKKQIAKRDNYTCQLCGKHNPKDANIHHWNYDKQSVDSFYFVYTCRGCNAKVNYRRELWELYFRQLQFDRGLEPNPEYVFI